MHILRALYWLRWLSRLWPQNR